jgi:hypothetical protein
MSVDYSGPAFPSSITEGPAGDVSHTHTNLRGISMRDHFAGKALPSLVSAAISGDVDDFTPDHVAEECYIYADAMIKARGNG